MSHCVSMIAEKVSELLCQFDPFLVQKFAYAIYRNFFSAVKVETSVVYF